MFHATTMGIDPSVGLLLILIAVPVLAGFCFNLIGDGLRDIIDPRTRT